MLFEIYAGVNAKTMDYRGTMEFSSQHNANIFAFQCACDNYAKAGIPDSDTVTLSFSAEEVEDD